MCIALSILPCFSDKSFPLGLAYINTALKSAGQKTKVFDFDFLLSVSDRNTYYDIHSLTFNSSRDIHTINFLGADLDLIIETLFDDEKPKEKIKTISLERLQFLKTIKNYVDDYIKILLNSECSQYWFSTYISNIWFTLYTIKELRKKTDKEIIIGGPGIHAIEVQKFVLDNHFADFLIIGEGEETAIDFIKANTKERSLVEGIASGKDNLYTLKPRLKTISPANQIIPEFDDFPMEGMSLKHYYKRIFAGIPISFSRGCINKCNFCSEKTIWRKFRFRPVSQILSQLEHYNRKYKISAFYVCDSLVNFSERWLHEFCDEQIKIGSPYTFTFAFAQAKKTSLELLRKMSLAGFTRVSFGIESLSQSVLESMDKGSNVAEIKQVISDAVIAGLSVEVSTIINYPEETLENLLECIKEFRTLDNKLEMAGIDSSYFPIRSLRNTFRLEPDSKLYRESSKSSSLLNIFPIPDLPPLRSIEKIALRWNYKNSSIDYDFKSYLAASFSNRLGPWRLRPEHYKRTIDAIKYWIDPKTDRFKLSEHVKIITDERAMSHWLFDYEKKRSINQIQLSVLKQIASSKTISEVQSLYPNNKDNILMFLLELYLDNIIILDRWSE